MSDVTVVNTGSVEETLRFGRQIGAVLDRGWVIGLIGPLGVGKTHLVKGIAAGNCSSADRPVEVTSPTFVLINEYGGRVPLYHVDAYRLRSAADLDSLGLEEMTADGAVVVEWADRVAEALPSDRLTIAGQSLSATQREWSLIASGPTSARWLARLG
jgi:tRNA threonylcarbamoyladenosine biosynthesis protein TsaE